MTETTALPGNARKGGDPQTEHGALPRPVQTQVDQAMLRAVAFNSMKPEHSTALVTAHAMESPPNPERQRIALTIATLLWLILVSSAHGRSSVIPVTPNRLDAGQFVFAVSNRPASNGVLFYVTITAKNGDVPSQSEGHLRSCLFSTNSGSISPLTPEPRVKLKRGRRVWKANFVASNELLSKRETCFVFSVWDRGGFAQDFYVIKLRDFIGTLKPENWPTNSRTQTH